MPRKHASSTATTTPAGFLTERSVSATHSRYFHSSRVAQRLGASGPHPVRSFFRRATRRGRGAISCERVLPGVTNAVANGDLTVLRDLHGEVDGARVFLGELVALREDRPVRP